MKKKKTIWFFTSIVTVGVLLTTFAHACPISTTIKITATDGFDSGSQEFVINAAEDRDWFEWTLDGGRDIVGDNGDLLGSIEYLKLKISEDPATSVEFYVIAGNSTTKFTIDAESATTFDPITNPEAYASAGITLTDRNRNGATITGLYDGKVYQATYNGSNVYANLVDSFTAGVQQTASQSENKPLSGGTDIINGTLSSIDASFKCTLSANDSASGTSYFEITPEPASATMLALGMFFIAHKRGKY
jgi:hypothetical protein